MNIFDIIVIAVLAFMTFRGGMKGMVSQIVSIGSYFICWIVASRFAFAVAPSIPAQEPWNQVGAMLILFLGTMIAIRFVHSRIEKSLESLKLKEFNRQTGALLGFAKGLLICMVLTFFGVMLSEKTRQEVFTSKSGRYLAYLIEKTGAFIPADTCKMLSSQIALFEEELKSGPQSMQLATMSTANGVASTNGTQSLWNAGVSLLDEAKAKLKEHSGSSESLLDAIGKWWKGAENTYGKDNTSSLQQLENQVASAAKSGLAQLLGSTQGAAPGNSASISQTVQKLENQVGSAIRDELNAFANHQLDPSKQQNSLPLATRQVNANGTQPLQQSLQQAGDQAVSSLKKELGIAIPQDSSNGSVASSPQAAKDLGRRAADELVKEIGNWANDPKTEQGLRDLGQQIGSVVNKDLSDIASNPQNQQSLQNLGRQAASELNKDLAALANDPQTRQNLQNLENKTVESLQHSLQQSLNGLGQYQPPTQQGSANPFAAQQSSSVSPDASTSYTPPTASPSGRFLPRRSVDHPLRAPDNLLNATREAQSSGKAAALFTPNRREPVRWDPKSWANSLSEPQ